jgi:hypothetical protein
MVTPTKNSICHVQRQALLPTPTQTTLHNFIQPWILTAHNRQLDFLLVAATHRINR